MIRPTLRALGAMIVLAGPAAAQDASSADARLADLAAIVAEIAVSEERVAALRAEVAALEQDRAAVNQSLIVATQRSQELEGQLDATETRMAALAGEEDGVRASLLARRDVLAEVLAALQRMGRRPAPALLVRPEDALASVRSAILLGAVVPELRSEAEALADDLGRLAALREEQQREQTRLLADAAALAEERTRLELLLADRQAAASASANALAAERARSVELAARAETLEELIAGIADRAVAFAPAEVPPAVGPPVFLGPADRISPAIPFASARGRLPRPASGELVVAFGADDGFGNQSAGISIATRSGARVAAPSDGWVEFAGAYRSYGNLLIVNAGDGYLVLLAGMERVDVQVGQFVLAGEPVGTMGAERVASAGAVQLGSANPVLYVEFRRNGTPIDPGPWWAQPY